MTDEGLLSMDSKWREQARCSDLCHLGGMDPELFFPPRKKGLYQQSATVAKKVCNGIPDRDVPPCPVRSTCLVDAIRVGDTWSIRGGLSNRERKALLRKWADVSLLYILEDAEAIDLANRVLARRRR